MNLSFALLADAANLSQEGKLNILGVFDALQVTSLPALHPRAALVVRLKGSTSDVGAHSVGLRWVNPNGDELWSSMGELHIAQPPIGVTEMDLPLIASIDLPLDQPGSFTMQISVDNKPTGELHIQVRANSPTLPTQGMLS